MTQIVFHGKKVHPLDMEAGMILTSHIRKTLTAFGAAAALLAQVSPASALDPATGDVVLTVSGDISASNGPGVAQFDLEMLKKMDPVTFETTTIWTDGVQTFTGVELAELLERLGVSGGTLRASAVNNYAVEIPMSDAVDGGPIIAYLSNGETMSLREKGPLWIVYPYDSSVAYQTELIYSRSIWQLDRIEVLP
jgi:hypothetical protein